MLLTWPIETTLKCPPEMNMKYAEDSDIQIRIRIKSYFGDFIKRQMHHIDSGMYSFWGKNDNLSIVLKELVAIVIFVNEYLKLMLHIMPWFWVGAKFG